MCCNNENNSCCCAITIISALLGAAGIAAVFFAGLLSTILPLIFITLILGIIGIVFVFVASICGGNCSCKNIQRFCLIPISIGAIVTSIFALSLSSISTLSVPTAILIGAIAFFLLLSLFALINVLINFLCNQ